MLHSFLLSKALFLYLEEKLNKLFYYKTYNFLFLILTHLFFLFNNKKFDKIKHLITKSIHYIVIIILPLDKANNPLQAFFLIGWRLLLKVV